MKKRRCTYAWEVTGLRSGENYDRHGIFRQRKDAMERKDQLIKSGGYSKYGVIIERIEIIEEG
jgi:hypothetical protein